MRWIFEVHHLVGGEISHFESKAFEGPREHPPLDVVQLEDFVRGTLKLGPSLISDTNKITADISNSDVLRFETSFGDIKIIPTKNIELITVRVIEDD